MQLTIPIAAFAPRLIEWLRNDGVVRLPVGRATIERPTVTVLGDKLLLGWGGVEVEIDRSEQTQKLFEVFELRHTQILPGVTLVIPDPLGFEATPVGDDAVTLTWPRGEKPRVDVVGLPKLVEPFVRAITLGPKGGGVNVARWRDIELVYA
jgi:hypothetical protein